MNRQRILQKIRAVSAEGKGIVALYNEISAIVARAAYDDALAAGCGKRAAYLSVEFLVGRAFYNNLMEAGILREVREILAEKGVDIADFEQIGDAALGNGGLGRLAACFLDSAAAEGLPLYGYGIRYKYGLFRQKIEDGYQTEYPDDWQRFGDPWSFRREDEARVIEFADMQVRAVPYDTPVIGKRTNILRLFQALAPAAGIFLLRGGGGGACGALCRRARGKVRTVPALQQHSAQRHAPRARHRRVRAAFDGGA